MDPVTGLICRRRAIGWRVLRLHVVQPVGSRAVVRIGWRASDLGIEPDEFIDAPPGVRVYSWSAPDDDLIEIVEPWSDDMMRALCRRIGSSGYERHVATDFIAWLADLPRIGAHAKAKA